MRAMESLLARNSSILSSEQIKPLAQQWNNQHCSPPLDDKEFEKQWKCATDFIGRKSSSQQQQQQQQNQDNEDDDLIGIHYDILQRLSAHIYSVVSSNPPVMYVVHKGKRKIIKAVVKFVTTASNDKQN